jgi:predicted ABC-type sugar transport system permease subunit
MDIRIPLGLLFAVFGALLAGFGLTTASSRIYAEHSLGINVNLWSGIAMLVFGGTMYWFARADRS